MTQKTLQEIRGTLKRLDNLFLQAYEEAGAETEEVVKGRIVRLLTDLNMSHHSGRTYLVEMAVIYYFGPVQLLSPQRIYEWIANQYQATTSSVRHAISYAIKVTYHSGNQKMLKKIIGSKSEAGIVPSNEAFVIDVVNYLRKK